MDYIANVENSEIDVSGIRTVLVQGDSSYPVIRFVLDPSLTGLSWRVRGTYTATNIAVLSPEILPTESATEITLDWSVGSDFTTYDGDMQLSLVGANDAGTTVVKALADITIQKDWSIGTTGTITLNLFEQLMAQIAEHNNTTGIQGGSLTERYHLTAAEHTVVGNTSGVNTGDQNAEGVPNTPTGSISATDVQAAINELDSEKEAVSNKVTSISSASTDVQYPSAKAVYSTVSPLVTNHNWLYDGRDLSTIFTVAQLVAAVRAADWTNIRIGDYWPITLTGTFRDYGYYTCPTSTNYYSNTGLTTLVGQTSMAYRATYVNSTYCSISISSTTYYVSTAACTEYYERTLSNATFKMEVAGIDTYYNYGDTAVPHHIDFISRDCLAGNLLYNATDTNSGAFIGSALFATLNNGTNGLVKLLPADLAAVIIRKRGLTEIKTGATASNWAWNDMGKLWLPTEREVWGQDVWSEHNFGGGLAMQYPIFKDSSRHIFKGNGNGGFRCGWWGASSVAGSATYFCYVPIDGFASRASAINVNVRVPLCFRIA